MKLDLQHFSDELNLIKIKIAKSFNTEVTYFMYEDKTYSDKDLELTFPELIGCFIEYEMEFRFNYLNKEISIIKTYVVANDQIYLNESEYMYYKNSMPYIFTFENTHINQILLDVFFRINQEENILIPFNQFKFKQEKLKEYKAKEKEFVEILESLN